jgi:hypothetical protein
MNPLTLYLEKKASDLKEQGQKKILVALFTGIGSAISSLIGVLANQLSENSYAFYWGTVISSSIFIPFSILTALSVWEKLKLRWSESDNFLLQKKFLREEYFIELQILEKSGMDKEFIEAKKQVIYEKYDKKLRLIEEHREKNNKYLTG